MRKEIWERDREQSWLVFTPCPFDELKNLLPFLSLFLLSFLFFFNHVTKLKGVISLGFLTSQNVDYIFSRSVLYLFSLFINKSIKAILFNTVRCWRSTNHEMNEWSPSNWPCRALSLLFRLFSFQKTNKLFSIEKKTPQFSLTRLKMLHLNLFFYSTF